MNDPPRIRDLLSKRGRRPTELRRILTHVAIPKSQYVRFVTALDLLDQIPKIRLENEQLRLALATVVTDLVERVRRLEDIEGWRKDKRGR